MSPVQGAVLDGLADVLGLDGVVPGEIGDGPGHLEDAVVGAGGEVEFAGGELEEFRAGAVQVAVGTDLSGLEAGVGRAAARVLDRRA